MSKVTADEELANIQLVQEVEKYPALYNYKIPDYSKRDVVEAAWNSIAEVMKDEPIHCKEKWRNFRTVFVRKIKAQPPGVKKNSYYLSEPMSFIRPFLKIQKSDDVADTDNTERKLSTQRESQDASFLEESEVDVADSSNLSESSENMVEYQETAATSHQSGMKGFMESTECAEPSSKKIRNSKIDDSRRYFLFSILPEIEKLTNNQMKYFRRKMLDVLDEAEAQPPYRGQLYNEVEFHNGPQNDGEFFQKCSPKREFNSP